MKQRIPNMRPYNCSTTYEWEDEKNNRNLVFEIRGCVSKYVPAVINAPVEQCHPAEGGELEEWVVKLIEGSIYDKNGVLKEFGLLLSCVDKDGVQLPNRFTPEEIKQIEDDFDAVLQMNGKIFDQVQEDLFKDAAARCEPDGDYLYMKEN